MQFHRGDFRGAATAAEFSEAELRRLLSETPRPAAGSPGASEEQEFEEVGLCVEAGLIVPGHFVAIRGWLADPYDRTQSLWLEIDGALRRLNDAMHSYRPDLIHLRRLGSIRPGLRAGFFAVEAWEAQDRTEHDAFLHAVVMTGGRPALLSTAVRFQELETRRLVHVLDEYEGGSWPPATLSRIARPVLAGIAAARRRSDWEDQGIDLSGQPGAEFSYLVGVDRNAEIVGHLLGFLEMDPHSRDAEVVFVLQSPHVKTIVDDRVKPWRGGELIRAIKVLTPSNEVTFGSAMRAGLEHCGGRVIAITSDEVIPPEAGWIAHSLNAIRRGNGILVPAVQTFDGRGLDFSHVFDLAWQNLGHDHSALAATLKTALGDIAGMPYGAIVVNRETALVPGFLDETLTSVDLCFADLFRREAAAVRADPGMQFIHNRLPENRGDDSIERLWNFYAFAESLRQGRGGEPGPAASSAPRMKPLKTRRRR